MTDEELAAIERRLTAVSTPEWKRLQHHVEDENDFHAHAQADVKALLLAVRNLRDERTALVAMVEVGLTSGRCPCCDPAYDGTHLYGHAHSCPLRNWREKGIDVAALTIDHMALMRMIEIEREQETQR